MKSCVSVMKLITTVIKKFITEGVNSCRLESPFFGCIRKVDLLGDMKFALSRHEIFLVM